MISLAPAQQQVVRLRGGDPRVLAFAGCGDCFRLLQDHDPSYRDHDSLDEDGHADLLSCEHRALGGAAPEICA